MPDTVEHAFLLPTWPWIVLHNRMILQRRSSDYRPDDRSHGSVGTALGDGGEPRVAVSMATSECCNCPPRLPTPAASHLAIASGANQRVMSPR